MELDLRIFNNILILTGAGISADSGISTFRDSNGLWENYRPEEVATPEAFTEDPQLVWRFYSMRRIQAAKAHPNSAHESLAEFSKMNPDKQISLITQNVDCLHQRAQHSHHLGPICMHGSLNQSRCTNCENIYYDDFAYFTEAGDYAPQTTDLCETSEKSSSEYLHQYRLNYQSFLPLSPCCQKLLRPHIVWFGEIPMYLEKIQRLLSNIDLFITIGTSGSVYPAAGFLSVAKMNGASTVCINKEPIPQSTLIDHFFQGKAAEVVPQIFKIK